MTRGEALLFAQREGRVLEVLGDSLPPAVIVGCTTAGARPVDTLALPAVEFGAPELDTFERLRGLLRRAVVESDLALLGHVSTESARLNQRVLAKDEFAVLTAVADSCDAAGVQVAHSGNVAGLLFDPHARGLARRLRHCVRALRGNGITVTRIFTSGSVRPGRVMRSSADGGRLELAEADSWRPNAGETPTAAEPTSRASPDHSIGHKEGVRVRPHHGFDRTTGSGARRRRAPLPAVRDDEGRLGAGRGAAPGQPGSGPSR